MLKLMMSFLVISTWSAVLFQVALLFWAMKVIGSLSDTPPHQDQSPKEVSQQDCLQPFYFRVMNT